MQSTLIIRADAGPKIGIGHVMRTLSLVQELSRRKCRIFFLSHNISPNLYRKIKTAGAECIRLNRQHPHPDDLKITLETASRNDAGWIITDGYHFDLNFYRPIRKNAFKLLVIDDHNHHPRYSADIILNQNLGAENFIYRNNPEAFKALGPNYALLRKEFINQKYTKKTYRTAVKKILITMGGADPDNVTTKVVQALKATRETGIYVKIIVGSANQHISKIKNTLKNSPFSSQIVVDTKNMPALLSWADLAISAGGSTAWELSFFGVPTIYIIIAENQEASTNSIAKADIGLNAGWYHRLNIETLADMIMETINNADLRKRIGLNASKLIDSSGAERIVDKMLSFEHFAKLDPKGSNETNKHADQP